MITQRRENYLIAQYIWAIQSDGDWYRKATQSISHSNKQQFIRVTKDAVIQIRRLIDDIHLTEEEVNFVSNILYDELIKNKGEETRETLLQEISNHTEDASRYLSKVADNLEKLTKEKYIMQTNPNTAIETKTVIFGKDAVDMSEQDLIDAIKRVENDIAKLKEVKTDSKKIANNIKQLQEQLIAIVSVLDVR